MRRRDLPHFCVITAAAYPLALRARPPPGRVPVVGFILASAPIDRFANAFRDGLREHGYIEGQSIRIEYRYAEGRKDRLPALISDLMGRGVEVFLAGGVNAALALRE